MNHNNNYQAHGNQSIFNRVEGWINGETSQCHKHFLITLESVIK